MATQCEERHVPVNGSGGECILSFDLYFNIFFFSLVPLTGIHHPSLFPNCRAISYSAQYLATTASILSSYLAISY